MSLLITSVRDLLFFSHSLVPDWGAAIILFTVCLRLLLFPLQVLAAREAKKLRRLQPSLAVLVEKHKSSPGRYLIESGLLKKQAGHRSWILPALALIQVPILIAIYRAIPKVPELHGASFLWIGSLSAADPYFILPAFMFSLIYFQQKWQQKWPMESAPLPAWVPASMSFLFMTAMPSALVLHSLVSTFVQVGGERLINRLV